jgi:predicted Fe-Mo cluster-binding NifX family protein
MKIAIPTKDNNVDSHFGHCESFTIYSIDESKRISDIEIFPSVQGCGCKSNLAGVLQEKGVTHILSGGIGQGAINVLNSHGISVIRGCNGDVKIAAESFISGRMIDSGETCSHHEHNHSDGHICNG